MRCLPLLCCLTLLAAAPRAGAGAVLPVHQEGRADVFEHELKRIRSKLEQGQWARAEGQLQAILASHARQPYVVEHLGEIELILKRCQFWPQHEDVDLNALLSGEVVELDRARGQLKLRYETAGQLDYNPIRNANLRPFAVSFSGPYSIVFKGEQELFLAVCLETGSAITVQFGYEPHAKSSGSTPNKNLEIERWVEITTVSTDRRGERQEQSERKTFRTRGEGATPDLKIDVGTHQVSASYDGRNIATVRKARELFGAIGFHPTAPHSNHIEVQGDASVWIQAKRDEQAIGPMNEFNRNWKLADHVPDWLIAAAAAPATDPGTALSARPTGNEAQLSEDAIREYQTAAAKELYSGRPKRCLELIADGIRRGVPASALQTLSGTANKALHGPSWTAKHTFESANYVVSSDISRSVSREVAQALEESLQHVSLRLGHTPDTRTRKFSVYVFSGERSYDLFVRDVFGARMENTLGMYSGALKQLLIRYAENQEEYLSTTRHEGFHQYLDAFPIAQPIWLNEGLAEYFAAARSEGAAWHDGALELGRLGVLQQFMKMEGGLASRLFPLERFVAMQPPEFMANAQVAYAQAWAFVHFLRHSSVRNRDAFKHLMSELMSGKSNQEALASAFRGTDWARLDGEFQRYVEGL